MYLYASKCIWTENYDIPKFHKNQSSRSWVVIVSHVCHLGFWKIATLAKKCNFSSKNTPWCRNPLKSIGKEPRYHIGPRLPFWIFKFWKCDWKFELSIKKYPQLMTDALKNCKSFNNWYFFRLVHFVGNTLIMIIISFLINYA